MRVHHPSILFIDAYDSFTNNIISLLTTTLSCSVRVLHIDSPGLETYEALKDELQNYDAVVCGPGPGNPLSGKDVGLMKRIWELKDEDLIPALGICLGFQSLAETFGAEVRRLDHGLHGMVKTVTHCGSETARTTKNKNKNIFEGVGEVRVTLYHSLCVGIGQDYMSQAEFDLTKYWPQQRCLDLIPLAWVLQDEVRGNDSRVLVGLQHTKKPFWGLQYHPESICTDPESTKVIVNWFAAVREWNRDRGRVARQDGVNILGQEPVRPSLLQTAEVRKVLSDPTLVRKEAKIQSLLQQLLESAINGQLKYDTIDLPEHISTADLVESVQDANADQILLESSNSHIPDHGTTSVRGRYSILGLDISKALRIEYHTNEEVAKVWVPSLTDEVNAKGPVYLPLDSNIWELVAQFLEKRKLSDGNPDTPFWGGFMGYTTYELGLQGIGVDQDAEYLARNKSRPDLSFAWVTKSIVIDHWEKKVHVQQLRYENVTSGDWLEDTISILQSKFSLPPKKASSESTPPPYTIEATASLPLNNDYESKVEACQGYIRNGDSYELCLTDQTQISLPRHDPRHLPHLIKSSQPRPRSSASTTSSAWELYQTLRSRQPAPFASYIRLGPLTLLSASPERFLSWTSTGLCELRPMKGTVKKGSKPGQAQTMAEANALLKIPKEMAENLMIVDLVRHDLFGVCGMGKVEVPRLMVVEEYESVFQMISVVQGQIQSPAGPPTPIASTILSNSNSPNGTKHSKTGYTGLDVLAASLPPGSMTGAPKKRSCEILREIEGYRERSIYSGVVGYMDVGGRGDFSVNIRCMFRWDDEGVPVTPDECAEASGQGNETWHIGAGGAVTGLSTKVGEREEMLTKLAGSLGVFGLSPPQK